MLKYTKTAITMILRDIKKFFLIFKYSTLILTILYYVYAMIAKIGNLYINIALVAISLAYLIFSIAFSFKKPQKKTKRIVKRTYKWAKIIVQLASLCVMIYGVYELSLSGKVNPISIILISLMIILWIVQLVLRIFVEIFQRKLDLLMSAWSKDLEVFKTPFKKVSNFFKKVKGEEIEQQPYNPKDIDILESEINKEGD